MAKKLDDIFNECFERMLMGESLEICLMGYPKEAAELETLLRTAFDVKRRAWPIQPRPEFKHWARVRLQATQQYPKQQKQPGKPRILSWQRSWTFALTAVLVMVLASGGTAAAAAQAMPDQPLYPVKLATEEIRVALTLPVADKAALYAQLAEKRAQEIAVMASQGKTNQVVSTATRLTDQLQKAESAIQKIEEKDAKEAAATPRPTTIPSPPIMPAPATAPEKPPTGTTPLPSATDKPGAAASSDQGKIKIKDIERIKELVQKSTSRNLAVLEDALEKAPEAAKPALNRAIDNTRKTYERTLQPSGTRDDDDKQNHHDAKPAPDRPGLIPGKPAPTSDKPSQTPSQDGTKPAPDTTKPHTGVPTPPSSSTTTPPTVTPAPPYITPAPTTDSGASGTNTSTGTLSK